MGGEVGMFKTQDSRLGLMLGILALLAIGVIDYAFVSFGYLTIGQILIANLFTFGSVGIIWLVVSWIEKGE